MLTLPPVFILALYIFTYIIGIVVPRLKLVLMLSVVTLLGIGLYQNVDIITGFLNGTEGKHVIVFGYSIILALIMGEIGIGRSFSLLFIILPISLIFLISTHLLVTFLCLATLLFYLFVQMFNQGKEEFKNSIVMLCVCLISLTLYSVLSAISFTSEYMGGGFVIYELTATLAFVSLLMVAISFASLLTQKSFFQNPSISAELLIIFPTVLFKLLVLSQSIFVLLEVSMQEQLFELLKWLFGSALILLGLSAVYSRTLEKLSRAFYLSIFVVTASIIFIQPSVEAYLPVYLLLVLAVLFALFSTEKVINDSYLCQRWAALCMCHLPLTAIPLGVFILLRILLSDGLVLSSYFILGNFGLLISAAVMFLMNHRMKDRSIEANLKLPIRTFFLISCTLLSTCLLVL